MFKRKSGTSVTAELTDRSRRWNKFTISVAINVLLLLIIAGLVSASAIIHQTNTNPNFCAGCHVMRPNVESYLTSNHLDHVHAEAGVMCKDCHSDYSLLDEIRAGLNFLTGNYVVNADGTLPKRDFEDDICTQCHGGMERVARSTDFLARNPHNSGMGTFTCDTCHVSHGAQIDYCSQCHSNGGQRMIEDNSPRRELIGMPEAAKYQ